MISFFVDSMDAHVRSIQQNLEAEELTIDFEKTKDALIDQLSQIDTLLGGNIKRPERWSDMYRHLHFGEHHDFRDIVMMDWPAVKTGLQQVVYEADEPIPVEVDDLAVLTKSKPKGPVSRELHWDRLDAENFERLMFTLIVSADGYENPQWLTQTNAPDRGRDLSVDRVVHDDLGGTIRNRVFIQCKHWLTKSISVDEIAVLKEKIKAWEPPRIDVVVIATSGRFTADAVSNIEKHNQSDSGLRMEMWPESHLEMLLASHPHLIAEFGLR